MMQKSSNFKLPTQYDEFRWKYAIVSMAMFLNTYHKRKAWSNFCKRNRLFPCVVEQYFVLQTKQRSNNNFWCRTFHRFWTHIEDRFFTNSDELPNAYPCIQPAFVVTPGMTNVSSVLWHCWLRVKKSIRPVKLEVLVWSSVWSEVQIVCIWSSWCHYHPKTT